MFLRVDVDEQQWNFNGILRPSDAHSKKHIQLYIVAIKYASTKKYHACIHTSFLTCSVMWGTECEPCAMCDMTRKEIIRKSVKEK